MGIWECASCGLLSSHEYHFCNACGTPRDERKTRCACGRLNSVYVRFCPACGSALDAGEGRQRQEDALNVLRTIPEVMTLEPYRVVGSYYRYDERTRHKLVDIRNSIRRDCVDGPGSAEAYLCWGVPGSGKTFFIKQVSDSVDPKISYAEINLLTDTREEALQKLARLGDSGASWLCLFDEVDGKLDEVWPCEELYKCIDHATQGAHVVVVLAGSTGTSVDDLSRTIATRHKGADVLRRIPTRNRFEIPALVAGDTILIGAARLAAQAQQAGKRITHIEKLALYFMATHASQVTPSSLGHLATQAVRRLEAGEDRLKYDHLFERGDAENKRLWIEQPSVAQELSGHFVYLLNP